MPGLSRTSKNRLFTIAQILKKSNAETEKDSLPQLKIGKKQIRRSEKLAGGFFFADREGETQSVPSFPEWYFREVIRRQTCFRQNNPVDIGQTKFGIKFSEGKIDQFRTVDRGIVLAVELQVEGAADERLRGFRQRIGIGTVKTADADLRRGSDIAVPAAPGGR